MARPTAALSNIQRQISQIDINSAFRMPECILRVVTASGNKRQKRRSATSDHAFKIDVSGEVRPTTRSEPARLLLERHTQVSYPFSCEFGLAHLQIDEGVFCPTLTKVSPFLLDAVDFRAGESMLDAFAGSGAFGINAALHGAHHVVSFDTSEIAVTNARRNAVLSGVSERLEVRLGTIEDCLAVEEQFDLVVANPPLLPGEPDDALTAAIYDPHLNATAIFLRALPSHLTPKGRCYLLTSSIADQCGLDVDKLSTAAGLYSAVVAKLDVGYECYRVHKIGW